MLVRPARRALAAALLAMLGLLGPAFSVAGCGSNGTDKISIGVKFDQPGLGVKNPDGTLSGFDVEVARYIAGQLGYPPTRITWIEAPSGQREMLLRNGQVDFIVGSYSITESRLEKVDFAGPYLLTGQSLLVRADESVIVGPESLRDHRKLCSVAGSTGAQLIEQRFPDVQLQRYDTYSACVEALRNGMIDAVTTDDVVLAGYAAQSPGVFKLVGERFSHEEYGIGVHKGREDLRRGINAAIVQMERDGLWREAFERNFGAAGLTTPDPPEIARD